MVEEQNELKIPNEDLDDEVSFGYWEITGLVSRLGKNETKTQDTMDKMWNKYGKILEFHGKDRIGFMVEDLEKEYKV